MSSWTGAAVAVATPARPPSERRRHCAGARCHAGAVHPLARERAREVLQVAAHGRVARRSWRPWSGCARTRGSRAGSRCSARRACPGSSCATSSATRCSCAALANELTSATVTASTPCSRRYASLAQQVVLVERRHHVALGADPLDGLDRVLEGGERLGLRPDDPAGQAARHERARHLQHLPVALGHDQADPGALALEHGVGGDGRAVQHLADLRRGRRPPARRPCRCRRARRRTGRRGWTASWRGASRRCPRR